MGYVRTTPKVLAEISRHRGLDVPITTLTGATGLTDVQVRASMRQLIDRDGLPITVIMRGQVWRYEASNTVTVSPAVEAKTDTVFERIGRTSTGDVIVRGDVTEILYVLSEIEF